MLLLVIFSTLCLSVLTTTHRFLYRTPGLYSPSSTVGYSDNILIQTHNKATFSQQNVLDDVSKALDVLAFNQCSNSLSDAQVAACLQIVKHFLQVQVKSLVSND